MRIVIMKWWVCCLAGIMTACTGAAGKKERVSNDTHAISAEERHAIGGTGGGFSCSVNGDAITDDGTGAVIDPVTKKIIISAENEQYAVLLWIDPSVKSGSAVAGSRAVVNKKMKHGESAVQRIPYKVLETFIIIITGRSNGMVSGLFSFTAKPSRESAETVSVSEGRFTLSFDENN